MADDRKMLEWDSSKRKAIIVDIDGTLALRNNRSPFDYEKASGDTADFRVCDIIKALIESDRDYEVFFLTGREGTDECRRITSEWINDHVYPKQGHNGFLPKDNWTLLMRPEGEYLPDEVIKKKIWEEKIKPWYDVVAVFDDRDRVVKMWRDEGLLCLQPYWGDF
jgi:hydroxymethylpyrimidine pyrophosphatase-like HAD family hydrolase